MVIIDAPPLIIADSYNLASKADGVVIVFEPGKTSEDQARAIKEQLDRANANVLGIVFNKLSEESMHSYGDYQYRSLYSSRHYGAYSANMPSQPVTTSRSKKVIDFIEHGKIPQDLATGIESAFAAIKTQPRDLLNRTNKAPMNEKTNNVEKETSEKTDEKKDKKTDKKVKEKNSVKKSRKTSEKKKN